MPHSASDVGGKTIQAITIGILSSIAILGAGCSGQSKMIYSPTELRDLLAQRTAGVSRLALVVPFEVTPAQLEIARRAVDPMASRSRQARMLKDALFDPKFFGLRYGEATTRTASDTIKSGSGNCFSLAAVYVGLARGIGLKANFLDVSDRIEQERDNQDVVVRTGHVTAVVQTENGQAALDFGRRFSPFMFFKVMNDLEATAHFYNNRGYELIHRAQIAGQPIDWKMVAANFLMATRVRPEFVPAWNNLGVAYVRLNRPADARLCYHEAISLDPDFSSPLTNLGILDMKSGNLDDALSNFQKSAKIDPDDPRTHYHLGLVLMKLDRLEQSARSLERSLEIDGHYRQARKLLARVYRRLGRPADAGRILEQPRPHPPLPAD